jgi:hypothetical protein
MIKAEPESSDDEDAEHSAVVIGARRRFFHLA